MRKTGVLSPTQTGEMLLIGSMPFDTVEDVFRVCGSTLGHAMASLPDGEVGDRRNWTEYLALRTFASHDALEEIKRPKDGRIPIFLDRSIASGGAPELDGLIWHFRVKPGVTELIFDDLHYAVQAIDSYEIFCRLRTDGVIPGHVRFQVGFPASSSAIEEYFVEPDDWEIVKRAYEAAVRREIARLLEAIPADDLAIQFDFSNEVADLAMGDRPAKYWLPEQIWEDKFARHTKSLSQLWRGIPEETLLGYHWCYGTWGGWPRIAMPDLSLCVALSNEAVARSERRVDYVHMPVIRRAEAEFFAPLIDLDIAETKVFLGLIHHDDDFSVIQAHIDLARSHLEDFGIAGPCGYGRVPSEDLPEVMSTHAHSVAELRRSRDRA